MTDGWFWRRREDESVSFDDGSTCCEGDERTSSTPVHWSRVVTVHSPSRHIVKTRDRKCSVYPEGSPERERRFTYVSYYPEIPNQIETFFGPRALRTFLLEERLSLCERNLIMYSFKYDENTTHDENTNSIM